MDKICNGNWAGSIAALGLLLGLFAVITAQPGFLSISCGAKRNHTTENNITWVSDADYIDVGEIEDNIGSLIGDGTEEANGSYLHSLRYFPKPLNKSCYQLPVAPNVTHLLRLWFFVGNSSNLLDGFAGFAFSIEAVEMLAVQNISVHQISGDTPSSYEYIFLTFGTTLYICLVRTLAYYDPFISAIELRRFEDGMYRGKYSGDYAAYTVKPSMYALIGRYDLGGNSMVRYPHDKFDRIWTPYTDTYVDPFVYKNISTKEPILTGKSSFNRPPTSVMQTAWVLNSYEAIDLPTSHMTDGEIFVLYFAEIIENASKPRSFYILIDGENASSVTLDQSFSVEEFSPPVASNVKNFGLRENPNSTLPPIINAYEYYSLVGTAVATYSQDIDALDAIKRRFGIKDWISDPCFLIPWKGIGCDNTSTSAPTRISKIDLSGRNLTGPVPNDIGQLTGLVSLYLQNNKFSGTVNWLFKLNALQVLNVENNNFSGVVPPQLLRDCSLQLMYSRNPNLLSNKRDCDLQNTYQNKNNTYQNKNKNKLKVCFGITVSGIVFIVLVLGIVIKFRRKGEAIGINAQEYSVIMVPNPTNSRAFTRDEMIAATHNFSQMIGRGGFGSVYLGKLPEGKLIAVKVLSSVTGQGIHEFLNEVDLLSKINHRNLVSLLGYCNQTKEAMLIYEYMSGGSLKCHLYGPSAENSNLHWKKRLKIALDAAQGNSLLII